MGSYPETPLALPPIGWGSAGPEGNWTVTGAPSGGPVYSGTLQVDRHGELYRLDWLIAGESWKGAALLVNGRMLAVRQEAGAADRPGLVWYTLTDGGDLIALWNALPNWERLATGVATGGRPGSLEGEREVTYFDPMGNPLLPALRLVIRRLGKVYEIRWLSSAGGEAMFEGIGLEVPSGLVAAWAPAGHAAALAALVYEVRSGSGGAQAGATVARSSGEGGQEVIARQADVRLEQVAAGSI